MIKRILVALSGTPFTDSAIEHAIELAGIHGAELTGVTIVDHGKLADVGPIPIGGGAAAGELIAYRETITEERVEATIAQFESACRDAGLAATVKREDGDPFTRLLDQWRYNDLTVFGLRGMFDYGVVHHPVDSVIRLMAKGIRPIIAAAKTHRPVRRILIAYKGSLASAKVMKRLVQSPPWPDAKLKIAVFDKKPEESEQLLADAASYCAAHGVEVELAAVEGDVRKNLLPSAEEWDIDCVAIGSSPRSRMASWILGDTVLHSIRNAEIPLYLSR